jgi:hypothetical protein
MNYKLIANSLSVLRVDDSATVPNDPANRDRILYAAWLAAGGVPLPADPPDPAVAAEPALVADAESALAAATFGAVQPATRAQLRAMNWAAFSAWYDANVTNAAQAIALLKRIAFVVIRKAL